MARVTLQTVADEAGVCRSTVSNAYNRRDQLSPELRERILDTARRLGYAGPNAAARSLRSGTASAVGVLFTETLSYALSDPFAVDFIRGLAEVAEPRSTGLLLVPVDPRDSDAAMAATRQAVVDGFCLYCVDERSPVLDVIRSRGLPLVTTSPPDDPAIPYVGLDERAAARSAAEHLARLGHEHVALLVDGRYGQRGPIPMEDALAEVVDRETELRVLGYRDGLPDARLEVVAAFRNSREAGCQAAASVLDTRTRPTAIIAVSDVLALGAMDALVQRGLAPGVDVSVVGFDDIPDAAPAGLTTVRQPVHERGRTAGLMLLDPESVADKHALFPTELVVRASTSPGRP